jgi:hypothetical protein
MELANHALLANCVIHLEKKVPPLLDARLAPIQQEEQVVAALYALLEDMEPVQVQQAIVLDYVLQAIIVLQAQRLQLQWYALQAITARLEQEPFARQANPLVLPSKDVCKRLWLGSIFVTAVTSRKWVLVQA